MQNYEKSASDQIKIDDFWNIDEMLYVIYIMNLIQERWPPK